MSRKNKKKNRFLKLLALIFILLIILIFVLSRFRKKEEQENEQPIEISQEEVKKVQESTKKEELGKKGERDRMEYYLSEFLAEIEFENYERAYNMLYDDFKKNYFPTFEEFEQYAKEKFPKFASIKHKNFERNGKTYVMWIEMSDALNGKMDSSIELNVLIQENDLDDFKLSFSVF